MLKTPLSVGPLGIQRHDGEADTTTISLSVLCALCPLVHDGNHVDSESVGPSHVSTGESIDPFRNIPFQACSWEVGYAVP